MTLHIVQFPCLADNYGYIVRDEASGLTACIDTPDADAILGALDGQGWRLDFIFNTHWHPDHAGGNQALKDKTGAFIVGPQEVTRIAPLDRAVIGGDRVALGQTEFEVLDVGGHTLQHIAYYDAADHAAFVGDSIFPLGCGRMFEGQPKQMWASLSHIAALPLETQLYCAHEYTAANARFALSVDSSPALKTRAEAVFAARARGEPTVPSTVGEERATNPFLRAPMLAARFGLHGRADYEVFAAVRAAKDDFRG
ncbi:MAG TPA: hydroxyacylglutathione hydrolase [Caulobacteraceae bacterium]|nr:hydroxyacylglutathione hydrolase [Caulobacteraceae bacterium]